jgi:hypothetical protein
MRRTAQGRRSVPSGAPTSTSITGPTTNPSGCVWTHLTGDPPGHPGAAPRTASHDRRVRQTDLGAVPLAENLTCVTASRWSNMPGRADEVVPGCRYPIGTPRPRCPRTPLMPLMSGRRGTRCRSPSCCRAGPGSPMRCGLPDSRMSQKIAHPRRYPQQGPVRLMRAYADTVTVCPSSSGMTVRLLSRPLPPVSEFG